MKVTEHTASMEAMARDICKGIGIYEHFFHVHLYNTSYDLPYHNWYHAVCMVVHCYEGATYYNLPMTSVRSLCTAALWHDYKHSGGRYEDSVNIKETITCFELSNLANKTPRDLVIGLIEVTEYPYVRKPYSIEQRIIRDADLMQSRLPTWYDMLITRLGAEITVSRESPVSTSEMIQGQIEFLRSATFFTEWARNIMSPVIADRIRKLSVMVDISTRLDEKGLILPLIMKPEN